MNDAAQGSTGVYARASEMLGVLEDRLPDFVAALLLLAVGWLAAVVLRRVAVRLVGSANLLVRRLLRRRSAQSPEFVGRAAEVAGTLVFWLVMLAFVAAATHLLGLTVFTGWLGNLLAYAPTLVAAALIVFAGYLSSTLVRDLTIATADSAGSRSSLLLGRMAQAAVLATAAIVGLDQVGIDVSVLVVLAATVLGMVLGGLALAFSLGARTYVANIVAGHALRQTYTPGQQIRLAGVEGRLLEHTPTGVVIEAAEGRVHVPAKAFQEEPSALLLPSEGSE